MKIFLSAVSTEFRDCRSELASDLPAVRAEVVVQEDFTQHRRTLLAKLEEYIAGCDRVITLVGNAYGFEPAEEARPQGRPRRSYTQWEYAFAMGERLDGSRVEREPLMRRALQIVVTFGRQTGYDHPNLWMCLRNYRDLLTELGRSPEQIEEELRSLI